ncbi:MAG TPA: Ig-like domain-containing protein [Bacteroidales bacterium]|nr:Ig-like domain-containing protein [Bacteroidales bacterium]
MKTILLKALLCLAACIAVQMLYAQPHKNIDVKRNTSFTSDTIAGVAQIIIDYPQQGDYDFIDIQGGFLFQYEPDSGFVGLDTVIIEYMNSTGGDIQYEVYFFHIQPSLIYLKDDYYPVESGQDYQSFDVLLNDSGTDSPFSLHEIIHVNNGFSYVEDDSLFYKPANNFEGISSVTYKACDSLGYCDIAQAQFIVVDSTNILSEDSLILYTPENTSIRFILPDTGFQTVGAPDLGIIIDEFEGRVFEYSPFQNTNGTDILEMDNSELNRTVIIHIIDVPTPNQRVVDDYIYTHKDTEIEFDVLTNDFISNGRVNSHTSAPNGTLIKLGDGEFRFIPDADFEGLTQFTYTTCIFGSNCETGRVKIFVGNLNPDNRSNYNLITPKNRDLVINYDVPIANFMFEIAQDCSNGELTIYPGLDTLSIGCEEVTGYNLVVYTPDSNYVGEDEFDLEYCVNGGIDCEIVKVKVDVIDQNLDSVCICADDCVWPGDINHDGKVDMIDLLSLGWHVGLDGEERPYAQPDEWFGQYAPNWDKDQINSSNLKHADVNGDGLVRVEDKDGINEFYNNIHSILNEPIKEPRTYPIMLEIAGPSDPEPGDYVLMNVLAGTENNPAIDLHGLELNFDFHPDIVDTSTIEMFFSPSSWLVGNNTSIDLVKHQGRSIDGAISRIDRRGRAGFGLVAQVGFIIEDDLDGIRASDNIITYNIGLSQASVMLGDGSIISLQKIAVPLNIKMYPDKEAGAFSAQDILVYPNPAREIINIRTNSHTLQTVELYDAQGRIVHVNELDNPNSYSKINTNNTVPGFYILRVENQDGTWVSKKVQIIE